MLSTQKWNLVCWQQSFYLSCVLYAVSWIVGFMMTWAFASQQVIQNLQIAPGQMHDAWYYISHNMSVEGVLLFGACTFGIGTGLVLCLNGLFDGMVVTAIARHYGLGVLLAGLLPHGLFEAGAWLLISTCGFLLSSRFKCIISSLWTNRATNTLEHATTISTKIQIKSNINKTSKGIKHIYFRLIIASTLLLVLAGIIEAYISPLLIKMLISSIK